MHDTDMLQELGRKVIEDLNGLGVPPTPECYEVWFTHHQKLNAPMSEEIEERQRLGAPVDSDFVISLYYRFCGAERLGNALEEYYDGIINQVEGIQGVARALSNSAGQFGADISEISDGVDADNLNQAGLARLVGALTEATAKAKARNAELEAELSSAVDKIENLHDSIKAIEQDANTDFLTKLSNRRWFDRGLREALAASRQGSPLCLIVCDVDHFKKFNDTWGHQIGDQVLKFVAGVLRKNTKGQDIVARYGGEEFTIALPNTCLKNAEKLAEQMRVAIARRKLVSRTTNEHLGSITMSFGVAEASLDSTCDSLFRDADDALYEAKRTGRNRVVVRNAERREIA